MHYDVIIIGGGPTGINCGIYCELKKLNYIVLEKGVLVNSIYNFPVNMTFFSTSKKLEIGKVPFISHNDKPTRKEALEYYRRIVEAYDLNIELDCKVGSITKTNDTFSVESNGETYTASNVIISTGFYDTPRLLNVPGEDLAKVKHYYDDVHLYLKKDVAVIGGANSACDVALECLQKGANVTMIVKSSELYQRVKYWILPNIENRIKEGSIKAYFNSEVTEITNASIKFRTPEGVKEIKNDFVLAMTGYIPHMDWFESLGVAINKEERTPILNDFLESNVSGMYLAGVAVGGEKTSSLFIENTRNHPSIIIDHILSKM